MRALHARLAPFSTLALLAVLAVLAVPRAATAQIHREHPSDPPRPAAQPFARGAAQSIVTRGVFESIQVNVDAQGANIPSDAANEPTIAIDPTNPARMAIGWRQFDTIASNFRENGWAYSQDGGATWTFPGSIQEGAFNSDPVLDTDPQGNFYYLSYPGGTTLSTFKSTNGGQTWTAPTVSAGGDKAWMTIDHTNGIGSGNIYINWQVANGPNTFIRSTNGGASFSAPVMVPGIPTFGTCTVDSLGNVFCAGLNQQTFNVFVLGKSINAQNPALTPTFSSVMVNMGGSMALGAPPNPGGLLGQAQVLADPSNPNRVYYLCSVNPAGSDPMDVHIAKSTNGGTVFGAPVRINDDGPGNWQWFGTMSIAPNGRLDVVWNDTRTAMATSTSETFYSYSLDEGTTWSQNVPVSPPWNSTVGWPAQNKIGDYYHMLSDDAAAHLAYSTTFNNEQDVWYLKLGDCNGNQTHDGVDLQNGTSFDSNHNLAPDECEHCQTDLGFGGGSIVLSLCGDDLTTAGSFATLDLVGGAPSSPVFLFLSVARLASPVPVLGGAFVPNFAIPPAIVFGGYFTNANGRLGVTWPGGINATTTIYAQAVMLTSPTAGIISNALEIDIGLP